ncbi:MAG: MFS transporter [Anaerolineales bacterium]|nr:MFS transporter [Anaerolineales bacterium]
MVLLRDALFTSVAYGHLIVDALNSQRSLLFTYWSQHYGMSNTTLATISTLYVWVASLSQPVFGWLNDRFGRSRLIAGGGILWLTAFFALALTLPVEGAIPCLILGSLGSAAFHPVGTMQATLRGKHLIPGRETTSTSVFFVFGQFGYSVGPIIGGVLLSLLGVSGLFILVLPALAIGVNAVFHLHRAAPTPEISPQTESSPGAGVRSGKWFLAALATVASLQSWAQQNIVTFVPKYLSDLGQPAAVYGSMAGVFMGGSAVGNVIGGSLADRHGRQRVAMLMLTLAGVPLYLISVVDWSPVWYLLVFMAGLLTGAVHSIIIVTAQRTIRSGMALASGLMMGFMFSAGALGTMLSGSLADTRGFPLVFQLTAGLTLVAAVVTLGLRERKTGTTKPPSS